MNTLLRTLSVLLAFSLPLGLSARGEAKVKVVTTTPGLASLAGEVGGGRIDVQSLAQPTQDPHFVDGRPSYLLALNKADLVIHVGLGLEAGWLPLLVTNARNGKIQPGQKGNLDASTVAGPLLDVATGEVDRRMGDVHPEGNPHYLYDPRYGVRVAKGIAERLADIDPSGADAYRKNAEAFATAMESRIAGWETRMAPFKGKPVVAFHRSVAYLTTWLELKEAGFVEPLPGISPSPRHLAKLILEMRRNKVPVVLTEPWYDAETSRTVAGKSGAVVVRLPGDVGAEGIRSYPEFIDRVVDSLAKAFEPKTAGNSSVPEPE